MKGDLIVLPGDGPQRKEPLTVTALRQQIRRRAGLAVLYRIAGGEAEYRRLALEYDLKGPSVAPPAVPPPRSKAPLPVLKPVPSLAPIVRDRRSEEALPERQGMLLGLIADVARSAQIFPGVHALGEALDCSWLVIERDLRTLARKGLIRIDVYRCNGAATRRLSIPGTTLATALPTKEGAAAPARP